VGVKTLVGLIWAHNEPSLCSSPDMILRNGAPSRVALLYGVERTL